MKKSYTKIYCLMYLKLNLVMLVYNQCMEPYCTCADSKTLRCNNFEAFEELDFGKTNGRAFESVELTPRSGIKLDLDTKFRPNGLVLNGRLLLNGVRSIQAFYNPFRHIAAHRLDLTIQNSDFKFIGSDSSSQLESAILNNCSLGPDAQALDFVFGNLKLSELVLNDVKFHRPLCPYLFKNTQIKSMIFRDPRDAFGFTRLREEDSGSDLLNATINQLYINHTLLNNAQPQWLDDASILNFELFKHLNRLNLNSAPRLEYIQENSFSRLRDLRVFEINNVNLYTLLTKSRRWLKNLNKLSPSYDLDRTNFNASMSSLVFQFIIWGDDEHAKWSFDNEQDICLFRSFPHNKLVFPFILFTNENTFKCTCTVYWLYKYFDKYQSVYNLNQNIVPLHCFRNSSWDKCKFEELFERHCPRSAYDDADESFTTLRPRPGQAAYATAANKMYARLTQTPAPPLATASRNFSLLKAPASRESADSTDNSSSFKLAAFYLAVFLSILCFFILSAMIVLFYQVYSQNKQLKYFRNEYQENTFRI